MSISTLKQLYIQNNLDFSLEKDHLEQLRKLVLLQLKSSSSTSIQVQNIVLSKNDVIKLFEEKYSEFDFDIDYFLSEYPELEMLKTPSLISKDIELQVTEKILNEKHFDEFSKYISENFFHHFIQNLLTDLDLMHFETVKKQLSYLVFFEFEERQKLSSIAKSRILNIFILHKRKAKNNIFVFQDAYYQVLEYIGNDDPNFLLEQLNHSFIWLQSKSRLFWNKYRDVKYFIDKQLDLNHSDEIKVQIQKIGKDILSTTKGSESSDSRSFNVIWIGLFVVIKLLIIFHRCSN